MSFLSAMLEFKDSNDLLLSGTLTKMWFLYNSNTRDTDEEGDCLFGIWFVTIIKIFITWQ